MKRTPAQASAEIDRLLTELLDTRELDWCLAVHRPEKPDLPSVSLHFVHGDVEAVRELWQELGDQLPMPRPT